MYVPNSNEKRPRHAISKPINPTPSMHITIYQQPLWTRFLHLIASPHSISTSNNFSQLGFCIPSNPRIILSAISPALPSSLHIHPFHRQIQSRLLQPLMYLSITARSAPTSSVTTLAERSPCHSLLLGYLSRHLRRKRK